MITLNADAIRVQCKKMIAKHERYMRDLRIDDRRRARRGSAKALATLHWPAHWQIDSGFDPYVVRANASSIARAVAKALASGTYRPRPPIARTIPKVGGGFRTISVYPIVESVLSRALFDGLMAKNRSLMSAHSYAYRSDLSCT